MNVLGLPVTGGITGTGATGVPVTTTRVQEALPPVQTPMFRSAVTRVRVDTIVTDKDGNFVDELAASDFRVFEDGVEQDILSVQLVSLTEGTVRNMGARPSSEPVPENAAGTGSIAEQPVARKQPAAVEAMPARRTAASLGAIVYLVDLPSMDRTYKPRLTKTFEAFLNGEGDLDIPCSVYWIDPKTGSLLTGENREFHRFGPELAGSRPPNPLISWGLGTEFPTRRNREFAGIEQGISGGRTGKCDRGARWSFARALGRRELD